MKRHPAAPVPWHAARLRQMSARLAELGSSERLSRAKRGIPGGAVDPRFSCFGVVWGPCENPEPFLFWAEEPHPQNDL